MGSKHCRLYDENLVHSIIISTGLSVLEYYKNNGEIDIDEICEYLEINANSIIEETIEQLNSRENSKQNTDNCESEDDSWSFPDPENDI
jgi:hypothetical protein